MSEVEEKTSRLPPEDAGSLLMRYKKVIQDVSSWLVLRHYVQSVLFKCYRVSYLQYSSQIPEIHMKNRLQQPFKHVAYSPAQPEVKARPW